MSFIRIIAHTPKAKYPKGQRFFMIHALRDRFQGRIMDDLRATVETWEHKPRMVATEIVHQSVKTTEMAITVEMQDEIWNKLNDGFQRYIKVVNYTNKTIPGFLGSVPGGGQVTRAPQIPPMDVEPRAWMDALHEKYSDDLRMEAMDIMQDVADRCGFIPWEI